MAKYPYRYQGNKRNKICRCNCSGTDKVATLLICATIFIVVIALSIVFSVEYFYEYSPNDVQCEWIMDSNNTIDVCGNATSNEVFKSSDCIDECTTLYKHDLAEIYYMDLNCYCLTKSELDIINALNDSNDKYDNYCFEVDVNDSNTNININKYINYCFKVDSNSGT
eukprot:801401_1